MTDIEVRLNPDVQPTGSDLSIVNAARRSFNTRSNWDVFRTLSLADTRLLQYLARGMTTADFETFLTQTKREEDLDALSDKLWAWRNTPTHDTPFNHTFISFEVKAPIFVRAQLVKHEYLIMSEFSRRYITDDVEFYEPEVWRARADNVKQGSSEQAVTEYRSLWGFDSEDGIAEDYYSHLHDSLELFNHLVEQGVAPEQARMVLPQSTMTEWTWSGTLAAFAKMCTLRLHSDAQYEARIVAEQVYEYLKEYYPVAAPSLVEGV